MGFNSVFKGLMKTTVSKIFKICWEKKKRWASRTAKLGVHFKYFVEISHNKHQQHMMQNRRTSYVLYCSDGKDMTINVHDSSYKVCSLPAATSDDRMRVE